MEHREWLTINYTLPREPSRVRVSVWRKLKKSGAVILGQSMWVLPAGVDNAELLQELSDEVLHNGGEAYLMKMAPHDADTSERIVAAFHQARDDEYRELLEQCDDLIRELEKESGLGKFSFAELEENEAEFQKLDDWHQRIMRRDFYGAPLRPSAEEKLEQCRARLGMFSAEVYRQNDEISG
ncbi:MAG TPA: Chromate resistance protein ChrB [Feifaniaceae bacterium]|nr:Chromate resistance protein ChrB [Feifaniaceae bacterium]